MAKGMASAARIGKAGAALAVAPFLLGTVPSPDPDPRHLVAALSGTFDTREQFLRASAELKVAPTPHGRWLDRQYATMRRVEVPALGPDVLYLEWRRGGPKGPITRQRLWAFDRAPPLSFAMAMRFYSFRAPDRFSIETSPKVFARLTEKDLISYPPSCVVHFELHMEWLGQLRPDDCRIVAQSGRGIRLDVAVTVTKKGFDYQERGILDDGTLAFAVPPTMPYRFRRTAR